MATNNSNTSVRRVYTATEEVKVLGKFQDLFDRLLGRSREGRELRDGVSAERDEILVDPAMNEAQKIEGLKSLTNRLVIEAGSLAYGRMVEVRDLWSGKRREWDALHEVKGRFLATKYEQLWAPAPGDDHVVIGQDLALRRVMTAHAMEMFAFTADKDMWAPYGRCTSCGKAIRPDRNGRLHKDCPTCFKAAKVAIETSPEDLVADAAWVGVTYTPADPVKPEPKGEGGKGTRRPSRRPHQETPAKTYRPGGRPSDYSSED